MDRRILAVAGAVLLAAAPAGSPPGTGAKGAAADRAQRGLCRRRRRHGLVVGGYANGNVDQPLVQVYDTTTGTWS